VCLMLAHRECREALKQHMDVMLTAEQTRA